MIHHWGPEMPVMITLSLDSCPNMSLGTCPGCYLVQIRKMPSPEVGYPTKIGSWMFELPQVEKIIININMISDIGYWNEKIGELHRNIPACEKVLAVVPLNILRIASGLRAEWELSVSINTFHIGHMEAVGYAPNLPDFMGDIRAEISWNRYTIEDINIISRIASLLAGPYHGKFKEVMLNYVAHWQLKSADEKEPSAREVLAAFGKMAFQPGCPIEYSPCIMAGTGITHKPCEHVLALDYIDGVLRSAGCPWPLYKPCELREKNK